MISRSVLGESHAVVCTGGRVLWAGTAGEASSASGGRGISKPLASGLSKATEPNFRQTSSQSRRYLANPGETDIEIFQLELAMSDIVSPQKRSAMMAAVRRQHTKPELNLRKVLHKQGLRFRLHQRDLPGTPDIVFSRSRAVIFVNGCFWHRHDGCPKASTPATRTDFWIEKFEKNVARDLRSQALLREAGWFVIIVWECEVPSLAEARARARSISPLIRKRARVPQSKMLLGEQAGGKNARRKLV
jgi:DNA mismatch endonuclease (patch repair protein)